MAEHTPGPWTVDGGDDGYALVIADGRMLASQLSKADACLMASAPDLLAALEDALLLVAEAQSGVSVGWTIRWQEDARAAIARATGTETTDAGY